MTIRDHTASTKPHKKRKAKSKRADNTKQAEKPDINPNPSPQISSVEQTCHQEKGAKKRKLKKRTAQFDDELIEKNTDVAGEEKIVSKEFSHKKKKTHTGEKLNGTHNDNETSSKSKNSQIRHKEELPTVATSEAVNTNKGHHTGSKRKQEFPEEDKDQNQSKKRVKTEEPQQETDKDSKHKSKAVSEKKKRRKKKRKEKDNSEKLATFLVQPKEESSDAEGPVDEETVTLEDSTSTNVKKVPKKKKKPKNIQENEETVTPTKPSAKQLAIRYLKSWKRDRSNWSFKKVRQIWLIKHLYDSEIIKPTYFKYLLQYLEESKGGVRSRLIESAQSIYEASSNTSEEGACDPVKVERARMIMQMLSE